jgi:tetratricopeptide (TPR) repeat protein
MRGARIAHRAAALSFFLLVAALCHTRLTDTDVWWHLAAGDLIRATGEVPRSEPFSYTAAGRPWIDVHWLFQVGLAQLRAAGGPEGLHLARMALVLGLFALLFRRGLRSAPPGAVIAVLLIAAMASQERFLVRPEIVSWLLMAAAQAAIDRSLVSESARRRRLLLWVGLPLIQIVWVNVQGLFMIGPALAVMAAIDAAVEPLRRREPPPAPGRLADFLAAPLLVTAACLVNPYGPAVLRLPFDQLFGHLGGASLLSRSIAEFQPTLGGTVPAPVLLGFAPLGLLTAAALVRNARRARLFDALLVAATLFLALRARRNLPIFAVAAVPVLLRNARAAWPSWRPREGVLRPLAVAGPVALAALCLGLAWSVATNRFFERWPSERHFGSGPIPHYFPEAAARFVDEAGLSGRVFHAFRDGGFLIDAWKGRRPVFIDGRNEPYLHGVLEEYLAAAGSPAAFEEAARRHGIDVVLWSHGRAIAGGALLAHLARGDGWRLVHLDPAAAVFVRRDALPPGLGERAPFRSGRGREATYEDLARDLARAPFGGPPLRETGLAEFFSLVGDAPGADLFYRRAVGIRRASAALHHDHAMALLRLGRPREAREAHERVLTIEPGFLPSMGEIGVLLLEEGRTEEAARRLEQAYALGLRATRVLEARARLFDRRGETAAAVAAYQEAINLAPGDPALLRALALLYLRHEEPEAALSFYGLAARAEPGNPVVAREAGEILEERGNPAAALEVVGAPAAEAARRIAGGEEAAWPLAPGAPWPSLPGTLALREEDRRLLLLAARLLARAGDRARAARFIEILDRAGLLGAEDLAGEPGLRGLRRAPAPPRR